jgi:hypothetical protein
MITASETVYRREDGNTTSTYIRWNTTTLGCNPSTGDINGALVLLLQLMLVAFQLYLQVMVILPVMLVLVPKQERGPQEMLVVIHRLHRVL